MKLMIDIPKDDYTYINILKDGITDFQTTLRLYTAIRNGIPLTDIKDKIKELADYNNVDTLVDVVRILEGE